MVEALSPNRLTSPVGEMQESNLLLGFGVKPRKPIHNSRSIVPL